ncbi:family 20 glycosylhydrolase [uncultured Algibacter sp.]|uniref:beta-N-acetylhexosaminidase n=1 Tax=uncultured Algibacter sp. TaxID=298659 RepID=UPI002624FA84|nr:family 20 glycosylhydrolase [uncultured Algibacter sp.]
MVSRTLKVFFGIILLFFSCKSKEIPTEIPNIIPKPSSIKTNNAVFTLDENTGMSFDTQFTISANFLKQFLKVGGGIDLKSGTTIAFLEDTSLPSEGYRLHISKEQIQIKASTDQGAFYAVQSLRQLLPVSFENKTSSSKTIKIPCVTITDSPNFKYRGMHLDVSRHMYSVDFIKKYIDAIAMLKMNTFHWHLTDDQGWRIEIEAYPKLNTISSFRDETLIGHYNDQPHQFDGKKYGGYYTKNDIKAIVSYAQQRFVTIIPEIEMPGHSQAVIASYPELGCNGSNVKVPTKWGIFDEIYCTKEETFNFLEVILDEVLVLFPSEYIHIGGDETPKVRWENCEHCQKRIADEGLKNVHELQNYFISRMEKYLNTKGRQIIGWDEILEGGLAPNATVMSWRGRSGAVEAAKSGHNVVLTPTSNCYFDYYQSDNEDEPLAIGGYLPLEKVYHYNPIPEELTSEEAKYVMGAQGNLWTEYIPTEAKVEYMVFPRMVAMSEVVWSEPTQKDYNDFTKRLEQFNKRLTALNINYANHLYDIEGNMIVENGNAYYNLETLMKDKIIRFTLDESIPNINSEVYTTKIPIEKSKTIKAVVFDAKTQLGKPFEQYINFHKALGAKITLDKTPHKAYAGSGAEGLINGISGSNSRYGDKEWLGFEGEDLEIIIKLNKETEINTISTRFYEGKGQWIYKPKRIQFQLFDTNGNALTEAAPIYFQNNNSTSKNTFKAAIAFKALKAKTIKINVESFGLIPKGKQGAGHKAWTFIDEIFVN